ncbi:MAG TPA: hypothetical protein VKP58_11130 [Candidatus Acidoferrum sp.]|nr:hypothetical protein [Candidatus Acidoferrum sp.]
MVPDEPTTYKDIFSAGPIQELLERPGELRYAGWDLNTQAKARIIKGEYLELTSGFRKLLRLYEDGTFIVKISAGPDSLAWGQSDQDFETNPRLNPLALVEFTLNFTLLCSRLVHHLTRRHLSITFYLGLQNAVRPSDTRLYLCSGKLDRFGFSSGVKRHAPENSFRLEFSASTADIELRPAEVAYRLLAKIYNWFGHINEGIPYVSEAANGARFVDELQIKAASGG